MRGAALIALSAVALVACTTTAQTPPAQTTAAGSPARPAAAGGKSDGTVLRRATLLVHDLERSKRFYELLGFTQWFVGPPGKASGEGLPVEGVKPGDTTQFVIMSGKDPYLGMIGLLQYGAKTTPEPFRLRHGDAILMIELVDLPAVAERLRAEGFTIHSEIETSRIKSVSSEWDARFMFAIDPDGHMVELTERLN